MQTIYIYIYIFCIYIYSHNQRYAYHISPYTSSLPRLKIDTPLTRHASFAMCENEALVVVHAGRPRAPKPRVTRDDVTERGKL